MQVKPMEWEAARFVVRKCWVPLHFRQQRLDWQSNQQVVAFAKIARCYSILVNVLVNFGFFLKGISLELCTFWWFSQKCQVPVFFSIKPLLSKMHQDWHFLATAVYFVSRN